MRRASIVGPTPTVTKRRPPSASARPSAGRTPQDPVTAMKSNAPSSASPSHRRFRRYTSHPVASRLRAQSRPVPHDLDRTHGAPTARAGGEIAAAVPTSRTRSWAGSRAPAGSGPRAWERAWTAHGRATRACRRRANPERRGHECSRGTWSMTSSTLRTRTDQARTCCSTIW